MNARQRVFKVVEGLTVDCLSATNEDVKKTKKSQTLILTKEERIEIQSILIELF